MIRVRRVRVLSAVLVVGALLLPACSRDDVDTDTDDDADIVEKAVRRTRAAHADAAKTRVVLFGVDAGDLDIIRPMVARGDLPNFARVMNEGASGKLKTIRPILSPIIWTTVATGKSPEEHGIRDFVVRDPKTGSMVETTSFQRRCEALWDILGRFGEKVGVVGWLASWPAEEVKGFMLTQKLGLVAYEQRSREDDVREEVTFPDPLPDEVQAKVRTGADVTYEELRHFLDVPEEEFRSTYSRTFLPKNRVNNLRLIYAAAETYRNAGLDMYLREKPDFYACYYEFVDAVCHYFMPYAPPRRADVTEEDYKRYGSAVAEAYRYTDLKLGEMMAAVDENTVILVVSDHGFKSGRQRLREGSDFTDPHGAQWHRPYGIFMAWGKGVKPGARVVGATVFDIAPTVLGLMGFPKADDMPGRFIADAFDVTPPGETVESYETGRVERMLERLENLPDDRKRDDVSLAKLESLGYIRGGETRGEGRLIIGRLLAEGRLDEAEKMLQAARKDEPEEPQHLLGLGQVALQRSLSTRDEATKAREMEQAGKYYEQALAMDSKLVEIGAELARIRYTQKRYDEAIAIARKVVEQRPDQPHLRLRLGRILWGEGKREEGEKHIREAVLLEPDLAQGRRRLGQIHLGRREYAKAVEHLRAAVELEPGLLRAWNALGVAYMNWASLKTRDPMRREERYDRAVEVFSHVIETWRDYPVAYLNRGQVRMLRGQTEQARADVAKALELDPKYEEALKTMELLRRGRRGTPPGGR